MSKEIWLGPVLGSNRERLLAQCAEYVSTGQTDRLLYIAASHPLLDLVTERLLDGKNARGVWDEFPVYLFRGFVRRVLSSAVVSEARSSNVSIDNASPLAPRVPIDREDLPLRRALVSQIIKQLSAAGKLEAIKPLANRDGCVNTIASLIGEIQRAGKTPDEFRSAIEARTVDHKSQVSSLKSQADFDREVALIYAAYAEALDRFGLTDEDADQLGALQILRGELKGNHVSLPWLGRIELLVLDGFFDFTPVQGEMLRHLIPAIPNVIVNINHDQKNAEIFQPFKSTVEQLQSIANFEVKSNGEPATVNIARAPLRERLFNVEQVAKPPGQTERPSQVNNLRYELFECSDRETEIRAIAKEIKRLILQEGYRLSEIALVVRERATYADAVLRVCADESIPCNLERRIEATDIPCVRACTKLFELFREPLREHVTNPKTSDIAHLVKSGYFRVSANDLPSLIAAFDARYGSLLEAESNPSANQNADDERLGRLRRQLGIGRWGPDILENVFAYVGSELRADAWLKRAQRLIAGLPTRNAARVFISGSEANDDSAAIPEREPPEDAAEKRTRKAPAPIHPAVIGWTIIVLEHLRQLIATIPADAAPQDFQIALMALLDQLGFSKQITLPLIRDCDSTEVPQAILNVRGLESLRRALAAAVRSFTYAHDVVSEARPRGPQPGSPAGVRRSARTSENIDPSLTRVSLSAFIDEVERCLRSQVLSFGNSNRDGLRVLEATDVRGLRFRAVFIAGMTEGGFPLRASGDWLYPHEERERLRKYGVVLEDISSETLLKEEHYFYQAACRATDRLYLTRPLALNDGTETVASYYIQELKRAIAPAELVTVQVRGDIDTQELAQASTASELSTLLIRQSERGMSKEVLEKLILQSERCGYISKSASRRVRIERERNGSWFGPFDGEISNGDLRAMLARHFGSEHVYSASALSVYGKCAFRFFASRVLKLEPRNEAALDLPAIDAGKLLHEVLRRFFELHRGQYLPSLNLGELRREMAEVADAVFREHELLVPALNERIWKIDCEIRKLILDQVLLFELRLQERSNARGMRPTFFELAFGRSSAACDPKSSGDYLRLDRPDGSETALLQGQIDRVDINDEAKLAIAYDYKLSQGAKPSDIEAAREVQIPIYLAALEQLFVPGYELAGGGYYRLRARGARLNQGLYRRAFEDCTHVTGRNMSDDVEWQRIRREVRRRVWQFIEGMRAGDFRVKPSLGKLTCKFCDYSAVCRYDTYRISRKRLSDQHA